MSNGNGNLQKLNDIKGVAAMKTALMGREVPEAPALSVGQRPLLLLDTSGSMARRDVDGGITRLRRLKECMQDFPEVEKAVFNDLVHYGEPRRAQGTTRLARALSWASAKDHDHVIVITDGQPTDDEESCYQEAAKFRRVDVVYAGPEPEPPFCAELARAGRGQSGSVSLSSGPKELTQSVRALLGSPNA